MRNYLGLPYWAWGLLTTTDGDVSGFSSTPVNVIEDFWLQFYNDNSEDYNAGVADSGSSSDVGKFFLLFKSCIVSEPSFIVAARSPSVEASWNNPNWYGYGWGVPSKNTTAGQWYVDDALRCLGIPIRVGVLLKLLGVQIPYIDLAYIDGSEFRKFACSFDLG